MNAAAPAVSVIIPTYERAGLLHQAVSSVVDQTLGVSEIFVVDDCSATNTQAVLDPFNDPRIHLLQHSRMRGAPAARNTGLAAATGTYIAFLDDDDRWAPQKIEKQVKAFATANKGVTGIFCYACKVSPLDPSWRQTSRTPALELGFDDFLDKTYFGSSVPLIRKDCLDRVGGFDETLVSVQDRDLWLRLARHGLFCGVPEVLVEHTIHGRQISADLEIKIRGREQFLDKYLADLQAHPTVLAMHYWKLGLMLCISGAHQGGQHRLRQAMIADPDNPGPGRDLQWSEEAPLEHARHLERERFNRVGDVVLYY